MFVSTKSNRFVQFTSQENGKILSEVHCLPGDNQLTPAIRRQLVRVGWKPPDVFIPSRLSRTFKGNFWRIWPASGKTDGLVAFGVKTLRDIFAIRSPSELEVLSDMFANCPDPLIQQEPRGRSPVLKRTRTTYEFFVRYPCGTSAINGYRRAARHFKLHTLEDPCSQGNDDCRLLIHKNSPTLREAAKVLNDAGSITSSLDDDDAMPIDAMPILEDAEDWLSKNDVHWFHHDWKYWDIEPSRARRQIEFS